MAPKWWISIRNIIIYLKPNFAQIGGFLYFGGQFWFKIANQNGRHMVQHVLLPVNIHFHWNLFIFEFLTIFLIFILAAIIYFCVKFQKDPLYGLNLTFFEPWLPWQRLPFWICSTPQKLPHTTVDIPTKFHEVWWKESKIFLNPPFFVSMATAA